MTEEFTSQFLGVVYRLCRNRGVEMPCPRCGKPCGEGLVRESIVNNGFYICADCGIKELTDKLPFTEWEAYKGDIDWELLLKEKNFIGTGEGRNDEEFEELTDEFLRLLYHLYRADGVWMPCPRCGKPCLEDEVQESIVKEGWEICSECGIKELTDRRPFSDWVIKKFGASWVLVHDRSKEAAKKREEKYQKAKEEYERQKKEYERRRKRRDTFFSCVMCAALLFMVISTVYIMCLK